MWAHATDLWLFGVAMLMSVATVLVFLLIAGRDTGRPAEPVADPPLGSAGERLLAAALVRGEITAADYHALSNELAAGSVTHDG